MYVYAAWIASDLTCFTRTKSHTSIRLPLKRDTAVSISENSKESQAVSIFGAMKISTETAFTEIRVFHCCGDQSNLAYERGMILESAQLLQKVKDGDQNAAEELLRQYRPRISKMVNFRIDPRIRGRVDQSDVVQETYLEVATRLPKYLEAPEAPFFLWIRSIARHKLVDAHRRHLGAQLRSVNQEISIQQANRDASSSIWLAQHLVADIDTPSRMAVRQEKVTALQNALESMSADDREILVLRHFEELSNQEAAEELGIETAAASKRFVRALQRLQVILQNLGMDQSLNQG